MHFALWGLNGMRVCRKIDFGSGLSPAPYSKLQRRHPFFAIRADKKLMLLFCVILTTGMGGRQGETLAMRTLCSLFEIRHQ